MRSAIRNLGSGQADPRQSILSGMNGPADKPPRSAALEDELAALELWLEDAKRKRQQTDSGDERCGDTDDSDHDATTSAEGE